MITKVINCLIEETCAEDPKEIVNDVKNLSECLIDHKVTEKLLSHQKSILKQVSLSHPSVSIFETFGDEVLPKDLVKYKTQRKKTKTFPFLEISGLFIFVKLLQCGCYRKERGFLLTVYLELEVSKHSLLIVYNLSFMTFNLQMVLRNQ